MKISRIAVYQVDLPYRGDAYRMSGGREIPQTDCTVVRIDSDDGLSGWGEVCPLGANYIEAHSGGVRPGIELLAPMLLGQDPTEVEVINHLMDTELKGHAYVKTPLDNACWDLFGKAAGLPVYRLLGGAHQTAVPVYAIASQGSTVDMVAQIQAHKANGYQSFQLKVGGSVAEDIDRIRAIADILDPGDMLVADGNTGWHTGEAVQIVKELADLRNTYIEQPCRTYEECLVVRARCSLPMVLDECMTDINAVARGHADRAMDCVSIKIQRLGGITKTRRVRDFCAAVGLGVAADDVWGSEFTTAAMAHIAMSTPANVMMRSWDCASVVAVKTGTGIERHPGGRISAPDVPGLGVEPCLDVLGEPLVVYG